MGIAHQRKGECPIEKRGDLKGGRGESIMRSEFTRENVGCLDRLLGMAEGWNEESPVKTENDENDFGGSRVTAPGSSARKIGTRLKIF